MPSDIIKRALKGKRTVLTEVESKQLVSEAGIPVIETRLAKSKVQAVSMSKEMGFPAALKIVSPDIVHKSDSGGDTWAVSPNRLPSCCWRHSTRSNGARRPFANCRATWT